ncbi:TPA: hypothetical protein ACH3X3_011495 [Trebouxia sp. C0006]
MFCYHNAFNLQTHTRSTTTIAVETGDKVIEVDPSAAPIVEQANTVNTSYIVSFIKLFAKTPGTGVRVAARRFFLEYVYANMGRFARKSWEDWCIPHGSLFEIGVALDV